MKADRSISVIGHIIAPILGLGLGYLVLCYVEPRFDTLHIFPEPPEVVRNADDVPKESGPRPGETPNRGGDGTTPAKPTPQLLDRLARQIMKAVVKIELVGSDGQNYYGSGVVVGDGIIATNYHVIDNARRSVSAIVEFENGADAQIKGILEKDPDKDLVLLGVDTSGGYVRISPAIPKLGEPVVALGSPNGVPFSMSTGEVSAIRPGKTLKPDYTNEGFGRSPDAIWIQTNARMTFGNSGGPLLDMRGRLVGLTTFQVSGAQKVNIVNFAISATHIQQLLDVNDGSLESIAFQRAPIEQPRETDQDVALPENAPEEVPGPATDSFVLDLSRAKMRIPLDEAGPLDFKSMKVKVVGESDLGSPYTIDPSDGVLAQKQPVDLLLTDFDGNVRVRLTLVKSGKRLFLEVAPQFAYLGRPVDLRESTLRRLYRPLKREFDNVTRALADLTAENAWTVARLKTRGTIPLLEYKDLKARLAQIPGEIAAGQRALADVEAPIADLEKLLDLIQRIDGKAKINYRVIGTKPGTDETSMIDTRERAGGS